MKRSAISWGVIGIFLLSTHLIFAQDVPPPADTQINADATNADQGALPADNTQATNADQGTMPADNTQTNTDTVTDQTNDVTANETNADTGSAPEDTQTNTDNAASDSGGSQY